MIPFKLTKKKLKQLLPPPELVLQAGLLPGAPRHLAKLFPGLGRLFSSFLQTPLWVLSCSPRRSRTRGLSVSSSSWAVGALPCISHGNPLHPTSLLSAEVLLPGKGGLFSPGSTRWHPQTESASLTACDDVLQCKAHPQALPTISTDSPSLLLGLLVFFLLFPMLDLLQQLE